MPKLGIIGQVISGGGVERFLHGLVGGMLELPEIKQWEISILLNTHNTAGYLAKWPDHITAPNVHVDYMFDDRLGRALNRLARPPGRIWGIYGTGYAQQLIPKLLRKYGTPWLREQAGDLRLCVEHYCRRKRFDLAYFGYPYGMEYPRLEMPMVATPHDFNYRRFNTLSAETRTLIDRQMRGWLSSCSWLTVSSEFMASEFRHFYPEYQHKVRVVRLGIPASVATPTPADLELCRQRFALPERFLLTVGWITSHKNQKVIFEALARLKAIGTGIPLVCIGPHSDWLQPGNKQAATGYIQEVLELAEQLGLKYGQDFFGLGYVTDFDEECLYRLARALVLPSLYEAGSFPLIEAASVRCAVACSEIPAHVEQASLLGNNIWLFDPHDAGSLAHTIETMLADTELTSRRAEQAARMVGQVYSWQKAAAGYLSVFREALDGKTSNHTIGQVEGSTGK